MRKEHKSVPSKDDYFDMVIGFWLLVLLACTLLFWVGAGDNWGKTSNSASAPFLQIQTGLSAGIATVFTLLGAALYLATNLNIRRNNVGTASFACGCAAAAFCAMAAWIAATVFLFEEVGQFCDNVTGMPADPSFNGNCPWIYAAEAFAIINILTSFGLMLYGFLIFQDRSSEYAYYYYQYAEGEEEEGAEEAPAPAQT